jgi:uncharacterized protein YycO
VSGAADRVVLQFSTQDDPESWAIRRYSHSEFSHVDLVLPNGQLLGARLEGGVRIREAGYAAWSKTLVVTLETERAGAVYDAAFTQLGKPYDRWAIAAFALGRDWRDDGAWYCSELIAWALEQAGFFPRPLWLPVAKITPGDLLLVLSAFASVAEAA